MKTINAIAVFPFEMATGEYIHVLIIYTDEDAYDIYPDCYYAFLKGDGYSDQVAQFCTTNDILLEKEDIQIIDTLIKNSNAIPNVQIVPKQVFKAAVAESLNEMVAELESMLQKISDIWPKKSLCTTEE